MLRNRQSICPCHRRRSAGLHLIHGSSSICLRRTAYRTCGPLPPALLSTFRRHNRCNDLSQLTTCTFLRHIRCIWSHRGPVCPYIQGRTYMRRFLPCSLIAQDTSRTCLLGRMFLPRMPCSLARCPLYIHLDTVRSSRPDSNGRLLPLLQLFCAGTIFFESKFSVMPKTCFARAVAIETSSGTWV